MLDWIFSHVLSTASSVEIVSCTSDEKSLTLSFSPVSPLGATIVVALLKKLTIAVCVVFLTGGGGGFRVVDAGGAPGALFAAAGVCEEATDDEEEEEEVEDGVEAAGVASRSGMILLRILPKVLRLLPRIVERKVSLRSEPLALRRDRAAEAALMIFSP